MSVYFIQAGGDKGPVKIGFAANVHYRISALQSSHYEKLSLIRVIEGGSRRDEAWFLQKFDAWRIRGEWFVFHCDMLTASPPPERLAGLHPSSISQAGYIVGRFGGATALATRLGLSVSVVSTWKDASRSGRVPVRYHAALIKAGRGLSPPLNALEFFQGLDGRHHRLEARA